MAFKLMIKYGENETCDKCKKPSTEQRPLVDMWTTGRHHDQRNFIQVHKDCLLRAIERDEKSLEAVEVK